MTRKTRVREHSRTNAKRVREHTRMLASDPREHSAAPSSLLGPAEEEALFQEAMNSDDVRDMILDGRSEKDILRAVEAWLVKQYVDPPQRAPIVDNARQWLRQEPSAEQVKAMQERVENVFMDVAQDQGRSWDKAYGYASDAGYTAIEEAGLAPLPKNYDRVMKIIPDEDDYYTQCTVGGAVNDVLFDLDDRPNWANSISRRQLMLAAEARLDNNVKTRKLLRKDPELQAAIKKIPATRKADPTIAEELRE